MSPTITLTRLAGEVGLPTLVVGPSLGTGVERLWGDAVGSLPDHLVVGWDLPGHGASPPATEPFDLAMLATAVRSAVEGAGIEGQVRYAGVSVGGAVGLHLLLDHPDWVAAAAVLCSDARIGSAAGWAERAALVRAEGMAPMVAASPGRWFGSTIRESPSVASRAVAEELAGIDAESYALVCEALGRYDVRDRLAEIDAPVLFLAGADDQVCPPAEHQRLAAAVGSGRFAVLRGVGHLAPLEDPARTSALLAEHFRSAPRRTVRCLIP